MPGGGVIVGMPSVVPAVVPKKKKLKVTINDICVLSSVKTDGKCNLLKCNH